MNRSEFFDKWSSLHGGTQVKGIVKGWLSISFSIVKPLAIIKLSPHVLTFTGVLAAGGTWKYSHSILGILLLAFSLICDGIDGSLAMVRKVDGDWGALTDSFADRISEFFWALAFYALGAPIIVIAVAWVAAGTQEYVRARMGGLGAKAITAVTFAERPVRASILFIAMVGAQANLNLIDLLAWLWMLMQLYSFAVVFNDGYVRLK